MRARRFSSAGLALLCVLLPAPGRSEEPFDYFRNSWNVIGLADYEHGSRITPENEILLAGPAKATLRFGPSGTCLGREHVKTLLEGWLPVVLLVAGDGPVRYEFTLWSTPLPSVKDWKKAFRWPTEGENFLDWVAVKATNTGATPAKGAVKIDLAGRQPPAVEMAWTLAPGQAAEGVARIPFQPVAGADFSREPAGLWRERTVDFWRGLVLGAARIEVPCRKSTEALLAAHVCQLIANDRGQLKGGEGFYDGFYIRDGAYQLMELEEAGLGDAAAKAVEFYLAAQRPDGRFETQQNQFDANGQALWVLWQYAKITGDRAWLARAYPQMLRAVEWMKKARRETPAGSPFAGVLPRAPADGEYLWDGKHHIVGYDLWNLRGLECTADAARTLGRAADADRLAAEARDYRAAIDAACKRSGVDYFPASWEKDGTFWGNTETLWPTELFARDDPRVTATIEYARRRLGGGFIEGTIQWLGVKGAIHPYMSAYTSMASLVRGEHEQVVEDFYWYLVHSTAAHAFPEGIFYKRRFAWSHTIPHVTGASNYAILLRHMLVHEAGPELHLLSAVPDGWLAPGKRISIQGAPTHFGPVSLTVEGTAEGVRVHFTSPAREAPRKIVLHLPRSRPMAGPLPGVEVVLRDAQRKHWDFDTVVKLYRQQAPKERAIPGLVKLPLARDLEPAACQMLDLAAAANTNPFTAPFGVEKPGRFLFTGMPVGVRSAAGVPFRIVDPAANGGRGLVVLHSPRAPKSRSWPRQVEIPVGQTGRRLFFLGNVDGWAAGDEGTGPWGAVAEYVIHYADGQQQIVPLITGRTIEDWTAAPACDDVCAGLQGKPWHLNVLGVSLRPIPVTKIVFRDLGTPAAPLLAAVTLEK